MLSDGAEHLGVAQRTEVSNHEEHGEQEAKVPDAIENECFLTRIGCRRTKVGEADQQIRSEATPLPADKHEQEVFGQDQSQHEKHEEVEVGEEAPVSLFVGHITDGVDVDQK